MALTYDQTTDKYTATETLTKQSSLLALTTNDTYVKGNIEFTLNVKAGSAKVKASQSITANPSINFSSSGNLTASYSGSESITGSATAGWVSSVSSATVTTSGSTTVTSLILPKTYSFTFNTAAGDNANDTSVLTMTNNAYRNISITNNTNATITATSNTGSMIISSNGGTVDVTSKSSTTGTVTLNAYNNASTPALTGVQQIVTNGKWVATSVTTSGTFYGMVTVGAGSASANFTNSNLDNYLTTTGASSSSYDVSITPRWSTTAGYVSTLSNQNGTTSYYKIITASPTFKAAPNGGSTASSSQITMDTTSTTAGIEIQTAYTIDAATISYAAAAKGWIDKAKDASTGSSTTSKSSNGTKYYVTKVTVPTTKSFIVETSAGASGDTGKLTIINGGNRTVEATNATNGIINVTSNSGLAEITSVSASAGNVQLNAYNDASTSTLTGLVTIVSGGKWVYGKATLSGSKTATAPTVARTTTTASGATNVGSGDSTTTAPSSGYFVSVTATAPKTTITPTVTLNTAGYIEKTGRITGSVSANAKTGSVYYITVPGADPQFEGGTLSGTATVGTWNNLTTGSSNTSGVSIVTSGTHARTAITYKDAVSGYLVRSAGEPTNITASGNVNLTTSTYYITGVTVNVSKNFNITIPNGTTTPNLTLNFAVDASGNVVVT